LIIDVEIPKTILFLLFLIIIQDEKSKKRIIIVHGILNRHWYKWLQTELIKLDFDTITPAFQDQKEAKQAFLIKNLQVKEVSQKI